MCHSARTASRLYLVKGRSSLLRPPRCALVTLSHPSPRVNPPAGGSLCLNSGEVGDEFFFAEGRPEESREIFEDVALSDEFVEFLTLPAYERLEA